MNLKRRERKFRKNPKKLKRSKSKADKKSDLPLRKVQVVQVARKSSEDEDDVREIVKEVVSFSPVKQIRKAKKMVINSDDSDQESSDGMIGEDTRKAKNNTDSVKKIEVEDESMFCHDVEPEITKATTGKDSSYEDCEPDTQVIPQPAEKEPVDDLSEKPRPSIANFFTKVSKEKRLSQTVKDISSVKTIALVHISPDNNEKRLEKRIHSQSSDDGKASRRCKRKISNVSVASQDTDVIEVI